LDDVFDYVGAGKGSVDGGLTEEMTCIVGGQCVRRGLGVVGADDRSGDDLYCRWTIFLDFFGAGKGDNNRQKSKVTKDEAKEENK
jgi:hypothetical protein